MASALSIFNTSVTLRSSSSLKERIFAGGQCTPPHNLLFQRSSVVSSSSVAFSRRRNQNSPIASSSKRKKEKGDEIDEDAFDALFKDRDSNVDDEDSYDFIGEEDLEKLQLELEETLGEYGDADDDYDTGMLGSSGDDVEKDDSSDHVEGEERPLKLKSWQFRRLAVALKKGRRKISVKDLAGDLCLERAIVLDLLRDPPPSLVMMSAALPDEPEPLLPPQETKPIETETETDTEITTSAEDAVKDESKVAVKDKSKVKLPVHVMYQKWNAQKRLKKVHAQTLERVYRRTKRPTNSMVSSIVHVTNLPRKRVVQWFEDKRTEEGIPGQRLPYRRSSIQETVSSS